jgi:maltose alpha-D-glucosyltransferase / alpha-amylase
MIDPVWYKEAVFYELDVKAFCDSDGDGFGDFLGLTLKLDYLVELGVTALLLQPFYPSPQRDDGYEIADYKNIHPAYGTMRDFRLFVREAHKRDLKVIIELVINHTSDQHPWFQRARKAKPGSAARDFYVWSDTDQKYQGTRIIFCDTEVSNWAWDPVAKAYYWHRFFSHQPDLNWENSRVFDEITGVMKFWLDAGVDGLCLDAIPYLCEREGTNNENLPETHAVIRELRAWLDANYDEKVFLADAVQWPEDVLPYFGDGDECHMAFHFSLGPAIFMSLAREERDQIIDIMRRTAGIPHTCQWAVFLRNHDELRLDMVSESERDYLWRFYAAESRARINLGIRRRLAPLLEGDRRKIELAIVLLFSLPGAPVIYYGDEIGMGDNVFMGHRNGLRTPMQWSHDRNAGFSMADAEQLYLPPIMDPVYGYQTVNVEASQRQPTSQLNWMRRLIALRKCCPALAHGTLRFVDSDNSQTLIFLRTYNDQSILVVANLSRVAQVVRCNLTECAGMIPIEIFGDIAFPDIGDKPYFFNLPPFGYLFFKLEGDPMLFHSCFISYATRDSEFAERLYADLTYKGVKCWFAPEDIKIGEKFRQRIHDSIKSHDKLLLILSESSINSAWVEEEVESALEVERRQGSLVLFPVRIDETVIDSQKAWAASLRNMRHIGDFSHWKEHDMYVKSLARLLKDLRQ